MTKPNPNTQSFVEESKYKNFLQQELKLNNNPGDIEEMMEPKNKFVFKKKPMW